ncbi:MAG: hypothetical protein R3E01_29120 [Pirellulaceae bacterium]
MTHFYDRSGIRFAYPENWTISEDDPHEVPRTVTVQSPSGAFWSLDIHPFSVTPDELLGQVLATLQGEYPTIDSELAQDFVQHTELHGYDVSFYCLDFLVSARIRSWRKGHATYLVTYQAEDRDFDELEPVFRAMLHTLLDEHSASSIDRNDD